MSGSDSDLDSVFYVPEEDDMDLQNHEDFRAYAICELALDIDGSEADLIWVAWDAYMAPLPEGWTDHVDPHGRVYFHNVLNRLTTWAHPEDVVFKDVLGIVKSLRAERPFPSEARRSHVMQEHLSQIYRCAEKDLTNWSGPYTMEDGKEYYYNEELKESVWESPSETWERQLATRQMVLHRCLLSEWPRRLEDPSQEETSEQLRAVPPTADKLAPSVPPAQDDAASDQSFKTVRSARTARSTGACSARSRSLRSPRFNRDKRGPESIAKPSPPATPPPLPPSSPALVTSHSGSLPRFGAPEAESEDSPSLSEKQRLQKSPQKATSEHEALPSHAAGRDSDSTREKCQIPEAPKTRSAQDQKWAEERSLLQSKEDVKVVSPTTSNVDLCENKTLLAPHKDQEQWDEDAETSIARTSLRTSNLDVHAAAGRERSVSAASIPSQPNDASSPHPSKARYARIRDTACIRSGERCKILDHDTSDTEALFKVLFDDGYNDWFKEADVQEEVATPVRERTLSGVTLFGASDKSPAVSPALDLRLKNAISAFLAGSPRGSRPSLELDPFVNLEQRERAWDLVQQYPGVRCEVIGGKMHVFKQDVSDEISPGKELLVRGLVNEGASDVTDSADIAGGRAVEKANLPDIQSKEDMCDKLLSSPDRGPQFFNLCDESEVIDDCEESEKVRHWLRTLGLSRYFDQLEFHGFDNMTIMADLSQAQVQGLLEKCPMPYLHDQQLRRGLERLRADREQAEAFVSSP
jgi:hypothetical protein